MSVRITIDIPDDLHAALRRRAVAERTSIRSRPSRPVTGPLVGKKVKPAAGSPDRENPYGVLFA
jgi:hypothetical protein